MKPVFSMHQPQFVTPTPLGLKIRWTTLFVSLLLTLSSCNASGETATDAASNPSPDTTAATVSSEAAAIDADTHVGDGGEPVSEAPANNTATSDAPAIEVAADSQLISANGIGPAQLGMTLGSLKQVLGNGVEFSPQSPFLGDFEAIAVQPSNQSSNQPSAQTLFYLLHLAGDPLEDGDVIQGILTTNPRYQTEVGVGVGTPIQTAEAAYGNATLSHNTDNESREYVRFEQHPATNISFTTQSITPAADGSLPPFAGIYASSAIQYNETEEYQADASIQGVLLVCLAVSCSQPQE